jgi:ligand-binding SRPBCC domain-containing protein
MERARASLGPPSTRPGTKIHAPADRCFDLARSIDLHVQSQSRHHEKSVGGITTGLIGIDQEVAWGARHFGVWQTMTSRITKFERPGHFRDEMVRGPFRTFKHDHDFTTEDFGTLMTDVCEFDAPLGPLGWLASRLVLTRHLTQLLEERGQIIRRTAESDEWRRFLPDAAQRASVSR